MIIAEARQLYNGQIKAYQEQQIILSKKKEELEKKIQSTENGKAIYEREAVVLELTMEAVKKKQNEYRDYMEKLQEQWCAVTNMVSSDRQAEAMEEYVEDLGKIMEVARRLMKGGVVPAEDEQKLMEYSMELYQAAKNMGALAKEREEYESLWKKEEEKGVPQDPMEVADNTEAFGSGPAIVGVADTMEAAVPDGSFVET